MPIGAPGCPELACCTASIANARMALAMITLCRTGWVAAADEGGAMTDMRVPMTEWLRRGGAGHFTGPDNGAPMDGLHLTADLRGCAAERSEMIDTAALRALCLAAVDRAGLRSVGELF